MEYLGAKLHIYLCKSKRLGCFLYFFPLYGMKMPHEWVQKAFICVSFRLFLRHVPAAGFSPAHCFFPFCLPAGGKGAGMTLPPAPSCGGGYA